ncbi:amidohydrolase family protein [Clostridium peptidivorans]|uniref:amidohydrolase family protein n=1 Tax=Clostridium peptidivorans TaxID=100174 RepID=UPI000BE2D5FF|nr:amidohydrolase family protein [Clostridium peptidivorans]
MAESYIVRSGKLVTVSDLGTIYDGAMVISDGKIKDIGGWNVIKDTYKDLKVFDYSNYVITPSLVDCHTHILEYAPGSIYPVTEATHLMGGESLLLHTLSSGITAIGEQICGHPECNLKFSDYKKYISNLPINISFSLNSISIGFDHIVHFTAITGSKAVEFEMLTNEYILGQMSELNEYPGENIFINATPANLKDGIVPRAGEIIYSCNQLKEIVRIFHNKNKKIGTHVAGSEGIKMALEAGFDVLHHAHGITPELTQIASKQNTLIVATPLGGTHLPPNSKEDIENLVVSNVTVSIATDSYLPPSNKAPWLNFDDDKLKGPETLMKLSSASMKLLHEKGMNENEILKLITLNGAKVLGKDKYFGSLQKGMEANFIVANGVPGIEIDDTEDIREVFFKGDRVIKK